MKKMYFFLLFICSFSFGQKKEGQALIDSLLVELPKMKEDSLKVQLLNQLSYVNQRFNPELGLNYAKEALVLATKLNFNDGKAYSYYNKGANQVFLLDFTNAKKSFNSGLALTKNNVINAKLLAGFGNLYSFQNDFKKAMYFYNKALKVSGETNDVTLEANIYSSIGVVYGQIQEFEKAITYFEKSLALNVKAKNKPSISGNYGNLANCYNLIGNPLKAISKFEEVLKYAKEINDKKSQATAYNGIGKAYLQLKNYDQAILNASRSASLYQELKNDHNLSYSYGTLGDTYLAKSETQKSDLNKQNDLKKASEFINKSLKIKIAEGAIQDICSDYEVLSQIQKLQGKYKESIESHELYTIYKDSVYNEDNKETIKNLEDKREIKLRDKQIKINKLSLQAQEKQKWFYILGLGFLTILGGLLFYQSYNRKQINLKLETLNHNLDQANKTKTRFFSILNHDLRSPVANLIHFLHLQKDNPELLDEATKTRMQDKTITGAENLLSSMEDILLWSKGQMENFKPQPRQIAINQLFEDTKKVFSGYLKIKFDYQNPDNVEIFTDENYLKTIVRNLTSNAINVFTTTENPTIIWKAYQAENKTFLSITDNGPGATHEQFKALYDDTEVVGIKTGLGLHLIRDLAKAIDCEISVDSKINQGTTFVLKLK